MTIDDIKMKYQTDAVKLLDPTKMTQFERVRPRVEAIAARNARVRADLERLKALQKEKNNLEKELKSLEEEFKKKPVGMSQKEKKQLLEVLWGYAYHDNLKKLIK